MYYNYSIFFLITSYASAFYDTFDEPPMDKDKWRWLEAVRSVSDGKLHLNVRSCDEGGMVVIPTAGSTSVMKADVLVDSDSYFPESAWADVRLKGEFFNDSRGPGSGQDYNGYEGEIRAEIMILIGEGGPPSALAQVWRFHEANPFDEANPGGQHTDMFSEYFTTTVTFDTEYELSIEFTGTSFVFKFNNETLSHPVSGPIYPSYTKLRVIDNSIHIRNYTGECGYLKTTIDNFYNDQSQTPYDTFDGNKLDANKWIPGEFVRKIVDGKLRSKVEICNYSLNNNASPTATNESGYLEAKVAVNDGSVSQGRNGSARINTYFYNEKRGPGSGLYYNEYQDNVWIQNRLNLDETGKLVAQALAWRSDAPDESTGTLLFLEDFKSPIELGKEYTLSIMFKDSRIIYKCNNETIIYNIQTPTYDPYDKHYYLQSRVYNGDQQCGFIDTTFDDIAMTPVTAVDSDGDGIPDDQDVCPNEDATGYDVNGDGCIDSTSGLETILNTLVQDGVIEEELQNSLISKVENANKSAEKDNICAAINQLEAFKNQVNAQRGNKISDGEADSIIEYADSVIAWLLDQLLPGDTC